METTSTIDQLREEDGDEPYNEDWSQMPLNDHAVQIYLAAKASEDMGGGMDDEDEEYQSVYRQEYDERPLVIPVVSPEPFEVPQHAFLTPFPFPFMFPFLLLGAN